MYNPKFKEENIFYSFVFSNGFTYDIPKEMIQSQEQLNEWTMHLRSKIWFGDVLERKFTNAAMQNLKN